MTWRTGSRPAPVIFASPVAQPPSGRHASSSSGPAARWIAPSTPPPPSSDEFAALTIASASASLVMSPRCSVIRPIAGNLRHLDGVDGRRAQRAGDADAMVAVAHGVAVADPDHGDRRQRLAAVGGEPHALPAAARGARRPGAAGAHGGPGGGP